MSGVSLLNGGGGRLPHQHHHHHHHNSQQNKMVSGCKEHHLCLGDKMPVAAATTTTTEDILAAERKLIMDEEEPTPTAPASSQEIPHMKELLLIHLDFIQQQSEQLTTKEKQIADLRRENEMLKLRIDRMERRVALQRNRAGAENGANNNSSASGSEWRGTDPMQRKRRRPSVEGQHGIRGKKHCSTLDTHSKRQSRIDSKRNRKREDGEGSPMKRDNHLTSESSYYTTIGERDCMWTCETHAPSKLSTLEVPQWRMKVYTISHTMEHTEDLAENVFDKRHNRLLIDEKRRKRWDVQRIREQRQNERLRQREKMRQEGSEGQEDTCPNSFWPRPHPALLLSVDDQVPISVFGIPITTTPVTDFTLPWLASKEPTLKSLRSFSKRKR